MKKTISLNSYLELLRWLRERRIEKGLSMRDMAALLGVAHSFIGKIETAERRMDIVEYIQFCRVLELNPEDGLRLLQDKMV